MQRERGQPEPVIVSPMTSSDSGIPSTMRAVLLTGNGGFEMLDVRDDVPVPPPGDGEVLIRVGAAGVNNTDVNTRIGWYSKSVTGDTESGGSDGFETDVDDDGAWNGVGLTFPRIQGADAAGVIVAVGDGVDAARLGDRVIVRSMQNHEPGVVDPRPSRVFGSELDGGFAEFTVAESRDALTVECDWTDVELASIPCAYSTAEGMLQRVGLGAERVLITGASGGVGSAAVQLAKRRGAHVTAVCSAAKHDDVRALGADRLLDRDVDLVEALGADSIDVVVDVVAGPTWPSLLDVLRVGGRYVVAGAIAGPLVELDVRTLYLKDLSFFGCTFQPDNILEDLVTYIEADEFRPVVSATYPLEDIVTAQEDFLSKKFVGKLVLVP